MAKQLNVRLNFQADTSQAQQALASLSTSLNQISNIVPNVGTKLSNDLQIAKKSAQDLQMHLNNAFNVKTGNLDLSKLDASLKASGQSLGGLSSNLLKAGATGEQAFLNIQRAISNASVQINQANGLLSSFWTTLKNTARWQLSSSLLHGFVSGISSAWGYAKDLDKSLNNIRIVTGYSADKMSRFAEEANKAAKALSTTTTKYTDASLIFYQQGLSDEEVAKRTEVTVKMANVAGQSMEKTSEQLTAVWNNFYDGTKSLDYYADVMTALGAATASSADEIAGGLEKFAAIGETIGLSYEYAAAALATITSNTRQSEEVVGTALKTIFARIQGLKLGETLEDGTDLNKYSEALSKVGISIFEQNGELKKMDTILEEMGSKWQVLSKAQQAALAQTVAGVRQYTQLMSLMNEWDAGDEDSMKANLATAYGAEGALDDQAEIYADSWQAAVDRVKTSAEGIYRDLFPTEEMTGMMKGFEVLLEGIDGLVEGLGGIQGILLMVASIAVTAFRNQIGGAIDELISKVGGGLKSAFEGVSTTFKTEGMAAGLKQIIGYNGTIITQTSTLKEELNQAADSGQSVSEKMALTEKNMSKGVSQALNMSMQMTKSAQEAGTLGATFSEYNSNLMSVNNIQAVIEKSAKYLTNEQRQQLVIMQEQAQAANEQLLTARNLADEAERRKAASISSSWDQGSNLDRYTTETTKNPGMTAYVSDLMNTNPNQQAVQSGVELYNSVHSVEEGWQAVNVQVDSYRNHIALAFQDGVDLSQINKEAVATYANLVDAGADIDIATQTWGDNAERFDEVLAAALNKIKGTKMGDAIAKNIQSAADGADTLEGKMEAVKGAIKNSTSDMHTLGVATGSSGKSMSEVYTTTMQLRDGVQGVAIASEDFKNKISQVGQTLSNALNSSMSFGKVATDMASGFSSIAMGVSAVSNAIETIGDEDASFTSKLTAGAMAATMGMRGLMAALGGLNTFINSVKVSTQLSNGVQMINNMLMKESVDITTEEGAKKAAALIVQKLGVAEDKKEAATEAALNMIKEKGIKATYKQIAADYANVASQAAKYWYISLIIIGITALIAIIYALVTAEDEETKALERANKALEHSTENYDRAKAAAENFKSALSDYEDSIKGLSELEGETEKLAVAVEEANKKARELIETYGLFGQYSYGKFGEIIIDSDALDGVYSKLLDYEKNAAMDYYTDKLALLKAQQDKEKKDRKNPTYTVAREYTPGDQAGQKKYGDYLDNPTEQTAKGYQAAVKRQGQVIKKEEAGLEVATVSLTNAEMEGLAKAINTTKESLGDVNPTADQLVKAIQDADDHFGLSAGAMKDLSSIVNEETLFSLFEFTDGLNQATEASLHYAKEILGLMTDDEYSEGITNAADGDEVLEGLMYQVKDTILANGGVDDVVVAEEAKYTGKIEGSAYDHGKGTEDWIKSHIQNNVDGVSTEADYNTWLSNNYSKIFGGTSQTWSGGGNSNIEDKAKAWAESQGIDVSGIENKNGQIVISGTDASGEDYEKTFDNEILNQKWAQTIANYAAQQKVIAESGTVLDPADFENMMSQIVENSDQYGADWANSILAGIANGGKFDFSTLFGELSGDEIAEIEGMDGQELAKKFLGITNEEDLIGLGFDSWADFETGIKQGLDGWDPSTYAQGVNEKYEKIAEESDIDVGEFKAYRKSAEAREGFENDTGENYADKWLDKLEKEDVEEYTEALNELAIMNTRLSRGYDTLASNWDDWNEVMTDSSSTIDEINKIMPDLNDALADILNWDASDIELLPPDFAKKHWDIIQDIYNGVDGAQERLAGLATKEYLLSLKVDTTGIEDEYNSVISTLENMPDLEVGMNLDSTGMTDALNTMLTTTDMSVTEMQGLLDSLGFDPVIEYKTVPVSEVVFSKQTGTAEVINPITGEVETVTAENIHDFAENGEVQIPTISGSKTTYRGGGGSSIAPPKNRDTGGGGGGGGGSKPKKTSDARKSRDDFVERYKQINDKLDDVKDAMDDANRAADTLWGPARLQQMQKVGKQLEKEVKLLKKKKTEAENYLKEDKKNIDKVLQDAQEDGVNFGLSFKYDDNGNISNIESQQNAIFEQREALLDSFGSEMDEDEQKALEDFDKWADKIKDALSKYDETKELVEDLENEIDETVIAWQENNFDQLTYKLEFEIEINDAELELLEYKLGKIEDDIYSTAEAFGYLTQQSEVYTDSLAHQEEYVKQLEEDYYAGKITMADYKEGLRNAQSATIENLQALQELKEAMQDYYGNVMEMALEEISIYTDEMDNLNSVLDHYSSILDLVGKKEDYATKGKMLNAKATNLRNEMQVQQQLYAEASAQAEHWAVKMANAVEGSNEYETYKKNWIAAQQAANDAQDQMLAKTEAWAQAMKEVVENELAELAHTMEETLTGGKSFDELLTSMERRSSLQEEYLTTTNQIYETNKLMRQAQQEIDKSTNSVAKRKLKNFIDETEQMQNQAELSQFELDIQQAKYDLLLAEIALEEAQGAKSTVRLQRDSEGNFGYVYTADQDAIANAEQELADKQNALYNIGLEGANEYNQKYAETMQEAQDAITELTQMWMDGEIESEEEYQRRKAEIQEYYYEKLKQYSSLYQVALTTDSNVIKDAWSTDFNDMIYKTDEWKGAVDTYFEGAASSMATWTQVCNTTLQETGLDDLTTTLGTVNDKSEELKTTLIGEDGESGVVGAMMAEVEAAAALSEEYIGIQDAIDETISKYEELLAAINKDYTNPETPKVDPDPPGDGGDDGGDDGDKGGKDGKHSQKTKQGVALAIWNGTYGWGNYPGRKDRLEEKGFNYNEIQKIVNNTDPSPGWQARYGIKDLSQYAYSKFDTGGYTGKWGSSEGRFAMLHEKELVLNEKDTENFLTSMNVLDKIVSAIDLYSMNNALGGAISSPSLGGFNSESDTLEQKVHIEASFPNVSERSEIEEALNNLVNKASQYANRKK